MGGAPNQFKDPDVWDPPSPPPKQHPAKAAKPNQWGAGQNHAPRRPAQPPARVQNSAKAGGRGPGAAAANKGPSAAARGKPDTGRGYDKPWLQPKKEKKEATTFLDHYYPDGVGPDVELITMMEREVIDKGPNVSFDDIADLDDTKKLL